MRIEEYLGDAGSVVILGHVRPDGDCVGSCLGLQNYLKVTAPQVKTQIYLETFPQEFRFLTGAENISHNFDEEQTYDLCFALDCSDPDRLGGALHFLETAGRTVCVDHHITNQGFCQENVIEPESSSCSEVLLTHMDLEKVDLAAAECLYLGIVHDTGVFKHSNTGERTMCLAGRMLAKGVSSSRIIDDTFYKKSFTANRILGEALIRCRLLLEGKLIVCALTQEDMARCGATKMDLDGIIDQMRVTDGVEAAAFLHETPEGSYKISMRSNEKVNVSVIASEFGGGGHIRAAGASWQGDPEEFFRILAERVQKQLGEA